MPIYEIDDDHLSMREEFLLSRAYAHQGLAEPGTRHRRFAATLLQDAGCVALLRGNVDRARAHLAAAGKEFKASGVAIGAALLALATNGQSTPRLERSLHEADERASIWSPGLPREMLSAVQAHLLARRGNGDDRILAQKIAEMPVDVGQTQVGETGLSVREYVRLGQAAVDGNLDRPGVESWLMSTWDRRHQTIGKAAKDRYHWRLLPRPTDLLELDSVILISILLRAGFTSSIQLDHPHENAREGTLEALVRAPLIAANGLMQGHP